MNEKTLRLRNKSLRQTADLRYTWCVESYAQAPIEAPILFLVTPRPQKPLPKPFIINDLHTLDFASSATRSFSATCTLFTKQPGVHPPSLRISASPRHDRATPCTRIRFPERGPFQLFLAYPVTHPAPIPATSIFTCKKKAIYPTIARNASIPIDVNHVSRRNTRILQEIDR
jgi:hypothetical protein